MYDLAGIGWITEAAFGKVRLGEMSPLEAGTSHKAMRSVASLFHRKIENFGRFDPVSRMTCFACVLALHDAGLATNPAPETGIIATGYTGSLGANYTYFKDFVDAGRVLARGNLFVYTLPSTPVAEAGTHFGLHGPVISITSLESPFTEGIAAACDSIRDGEAPAMLVVQAEATCALAALVVPAVNSPTALPLLDTFRECSQNQSCLADLITTISVRIQQGALLCE